MVVIKDEAGSTTLFQFDDAADLGTGTATAILLNKKSLVENFSFDTSLKVRNGYKSLVKRRTGKKNSNLSLEVLFAGASRDGRIDEFISVLTGNEFITLDSESYQDRLDGQYAPTGRLRQKKDEETETIMLTVKLVEKED